MTFWEVRKSGLAGWNGDKTKLAKSRSDSIGPVNTTLAFANARQLL